MKNLLFITVIFLAAVACDMTTYSQYTITSLSDFEYDISNFDSDSLFQTAPFYGGASSYSIVFNSMRTDTGEKMTGGLAATMKRDSSIVLKSSNPYPQYTMFAVSAASGSNVCAVYYQNDVEDLMPEHDIIFLDSDYGTCSPSYFVINNTQQTVFDVLSEDSSSKYEPGDYLKLTITGSKTNEYTGAVEKTGSIEYYLADWRKGWAVPDSVLTSWKTVSLSKLGNIDYIDFNLESNKDNLIKTFCFDNLVTNIFVKY